MTAQQLWDAFIMHSESYEKALDRRVLTLAKRGYAQYENTHFHDVQDLGLKARFCEFMVDGQAGALVIRLCRNIAYGRSGRYILCVCITDKVMNHFHGQDKAFFSVVDEEWHLQVIAHLTQKRKAGTLQYIN